MALDSNLASGTKTGDRSRSVDKKVLMKIKWKDSDVILQAET